MHWSELLLLLQSDVFTHAAVQAFACCLWACFE
jgi:hypothetical protein